ncbi:hypothetical protein [Chryseobacterium sp. Leaf405]|uniref:hypothetical protein n=1 Tax=Chryseobacterium sp. Leaf405 TaxID=1736367 RepID=UPI00396486A5
MYSNATRLVCPVKMKFCIIIEHQKRIHSFHIDSLNIRNEIMNPKTVTYKMSRFRSYHDLYFFGCHNIVGIMNQRYFS